MYYRSSPTRFVWGVAIALAILGALVVGHVGRVDAAYRRGKDEARKGATFDSAMKARAEEAVQLRTRHTDTVTQRIVVTRWRVESLLVALPDSAKVLPVVPELVATARELVSDVDSLTAAHATERSAWVELRTQDSTAIDAVRVESSARRDTITDLRKRPSKKTAAFLTLLGALMGAVVTR